MNYTKKSANTILTFKQRLQRQQNYLQPGAAPLPTPPAVSSEE